MYLVSNAHNIGHIPLYKWCDCDGVGATETTPHRMVRVFLWQRIPAYTSNILSQYNESSAYVQHLAIKILVLAHCMCCCDVYMDTQCDSEIDKKPKRQTECFSLSLGLPVACWIRLPPSLAHQINGINAISRVRR